MNWLDPDSGGFLAKLAGAVVTVGAGIMVARKRLSGDSTELVRNSAERDIMGNLRTERDKYLAMWETAQQQANQFAIVNENLRGQVEHLTKDNAALSLQVSKLDNNVRDLRRILLEALPTRAAEILATDLKEPS